MSEPSQARAEVGISLLTFEARVFLLLPGKAGPSRFSPSASTLSGQCSTPLTSAGHVPLELRQSPPSSLAFRSCVLLLPLSLARGCRLQGLEALKSALRLSVSAAMASTTLARPDDERNSLAIYGYPVAQSVSPKIFNHLFPLLCVARLFKRRQRRRTDFVKDRGLPRHKYKAVECRSLDESGNAWEEAVKLPDCLGTCLTMPLKVRAVRPVPSPAKLTLLSTPAAGAAKSRRADT